MSSIIPFRFGTATDRQTQDLSELLATGTESINTSAFAYERLPIPIRDWTNQEMADLARVQYLLSRAGVPLETDRGITDEGDPWFVFCDLSGEVFVHICRMGMTYLLDGPSLEEPLRGPSFDSLVKSFIDRATAKVAALNVVPLNKGTKVFLHPSVMLTALIWSLFLLNDQMTNAAYASTLEDGAHNAAIDPASYDVETAFALLADALQDKGDDVEQLSGLKALAKLDPTDRETVSSDKISILSQSVMSPTVIASLSAIALAFGLLKPAESMAASLPEISIIEASATTNDIIHVLPVDVVERHTPAKADEGSHGVDQPQLTQDASSWLPAAGNGTSIDLSTELRVVSLDLLGMLAQSHDFATSAGGTSTAAADPGRDLILNGPATARNGAAPVRGEAEVSRTETHETTTAAKEAEASPSSTVVLSTSSPILTFAQLADQIVKHGEGLIVVHAADAQSIATTKVAGSIHDLLVTTYTDNTSDAVKALLKFDLSEATSGKTDSPASASDSPAAAEASADATVKAVVEATASHTAPPLAPGDTATKPLFGLYSEAARELVDFLLAKEKDIVVITLANEIIILDKSALDEATDIAYAKSWSVEGGGVVSTIGHFQDYVDFGALS